MTIERIDMRNFRNFSQREISFSSWINLIIAKNGSGKTNILEALSFPYGYFVENHGEYLVKQGEKNYYLTLELETQRIAHSYSIDGKRKQYFLEWKNTTLKKVRECMPHVIYFHPLHMNLLYGSPSMRRDYLDSLLGNIYFEYKKILTQYKKILTGRNKVLKNISLGLSEKNELSFWDTQFIESASQVYAYRKKIVDFFNAELPKLKSYFFGKVEELSFHYLSKINIDQAKQELQTYIKENQNKEILLCKTLRGPHLDDFDILADGVSLTHFASRGEIKSILLGMKFLEQEYIEEYIDGACFVYFIDDLLSELDNDHRALLLKQIGNRQAIITSISDIDIDSQKIFL